MTIRVALAGATGKMGQAVIRAVAGAPDMELVGAVAPDRTGDDAAWVGGLREATGVLVRPDLEGCLEETRPDVLIDFTAPEVVSGNLMACLEAGVRPVFGTTGLSDAAYLNAERLAGERGIGGLVAPNFAIGVLLLMRFAEQAARYFEHAEIIELHHNQKKDAPSGTAIATAHRLAAARPRYGKTNAPETELLEGARGAETETGVRIHSVRLPGMVAHQEVLFGAPGQILTLRHDAMDRESYMPGVLLGVRKVLGLSRLVRGLETLMD